MGFKRLVRRLLVDKLPVHYRLDIERAYLYHYYGNACIKKEIKIFKQLSDPHKISLDIGANEGIMTLYLSDFSSHVYCFEPIPWLYEHLRNKFHGCNVSVIGCALGNSDGEFTINIPWIGDKRFETRSSLLKDFMNEKILGEDATRVERIKVNVKRLDDFNISNIGFIKIDVEGFENEVLEGGRSTIKADLSFPSNFVFQG